MTLKLRTMVEMLDEVRLARKEIELAEESISYGGNATTMHHKQLRLASSKQALEILLNTEISI